MIRIKKPRRGRVVTEPPPASQYFGYTNVDADSITMMAAGALNLEGQSPWTFYQTADAPEGAWIHYGHDPITATLTLPTALLRGTTYYIFVYFGDYDVHRTVTCVCGGSTSTVVTTDDRDAASGYWSFPACILTPASTSATMVITFAGNTSTDAARLFRGIYITTNANLTMLRDGTAVNLTFPTVMDNSAAVKGNLIPNSGFETGVDSAWGFYSQGSGRTVPVNDMWDNTQGRSGAACLKLSCDSATRFTPSNTAEVIISRVYHLKPNKTYTVSAYFKTSVGLTTDVTVELKNTFVPPAGFDPQYSITSGAVSINSAGWTRVSVTGYAKAYPTPDFQIYITTSGGDGTYILIDDVQLEEGSLDTYAPAANVEAGLVFNVATYPGNIYYTTDSLTTDLVVRNHTGGTLSRTLSYEIYDFQNALVASGTQSLSSIPGNTTQTSSFSIAAGGKQGIFRVVTWLDSEALTEREYTYAIIPEPAESGVDTTSFLGIHPNYYDRSLDVYQRLGIKWVRDLSPAAHGRWSVVEPSDDTFVFYDTQKAAAIDHGMTDVCVLGTNNFWPAWANNVNVPDLPKWGEFCQQMVEHYNGINGPLVKYWEIWNEPGAEAPGLTSAFYAQMLKTATDAILGEDATANVVGMGGVTDTHMQEIIDEIESQYPAWDWQSDLAALATHDYPTGEPPEDLTPILNTYGVPIWNTESGYKDLGFKQGPNSNFISWGISIWPHIPASRFNNGMIGAVGNVTETFLRTIASGQTKYFYYDGRLDADPSKFVHIYSMLDHDLTIKAKGIAYAIAGSLIYQATTLGNIVSGENSYVLVFDAPAAPIAALFSSDFSAKQIVCTLNSNQFEVLDVMGNVISASSPIPFGRIPIYVRGVGISAATLAAGFGAITTRADTAAPNISISDGPRGVIAAGTPFRVRWIASDDTSYPNTGEIDGETQGTTGTPNPLAITYSYQLTPYSTWSSWVAGAYVDYSGLAAGNYTFSVRAKDEAGNISQADRTITVS